MIVVEHTDCWKDSTPKSPMKHNNRKVSSEWVGAPGTVTLCERKNDAVQETITPTARDIRALNRAKRAEEQASVDNNQVTGKVIGSEMISQASFDSIDSTAHVLNDSKLHSFIQQDQHHRVLEPSLSLESELDIENHAALKYSLVHENRIVDSPITGQEMKKPINFPAASDKIWEKVNSELEVLIPSLFSDSMINKLSSSDLSHKFDSWLHQYFFDRFGEKGETAGPRKTREARESAAITILRSKKKACKKAYKLLVREGREKTQEGIIVSREFKTLIRQHNKLRRQLIQKKNQTKKLAHEKLFKKDPNAFAQKLFQKVAKSQSPTFSAEQAEDFFRKTYSDSDRSYQYQPMPEMVRPNFPDQVFSLRCPTLLETMKSVKRKRNGAAAGLNGLTYVPYKKCAAIIKFVVKLGRKIWKTKEIPADWACAYIVLLSKSDILDLVSEFRPIAIASTAGKIFFSVLSDRLQSFLIRNNFISREIQKGFLSGVAGCVEHVFALMEALRDAKDHMRQIIITWLDLANAYGSVRHNLIAFALNWYHVPLFVQELIFDYYEKLCAQVRSKEWSTGFFLFDIGLFQGCVLSTILFDCVFQLLLDFLRPIKKLGYNYKAVPEVTAHTKAYADDLSLVTRNAADNQISCDRTHYWLMWTVTMKAKPSKCVSMGMKKFVSSIKNEAFTPLFDRTYSPFNPCLSINGHPISFIFSPENADSFKGEHFKFLGRWIHYDLDENPIKEKIKRNFLLDLQLVNDSLINGFMKLWLYQFYILARLSWPLLIYDFDRSFVNQLLRLSNSFLKKWAGIGAKVDCGLLYRSKEHFGLGLTSVLDHFESMQLVKCELLKNSTDLSIVKLYKNKETVNSKLSRVWRASNLAQIANAEVNLELQFPNQINRAGLGFGNFNPNPSAVMRRRLVTRKARSFNEEARIAHATSLCRQGAWLQWSDNVIPFDLSWKNLIWSTNQQIIRFVLKCSVNWVHSPDLLKLWGYITDSQCSLCQAPICSLHHILVHCPVALEDKRYTWRHDSILLHIQSALQKLVARQNLKPRSSAIPHISKSFVKAGCTPKLPKDVQRPTGLDGASDWKLSVDIANSLLFPPEIVATDQRPDIVMWSNALKKVILIELTCPAEEGMDAAKLRKETRYMKLLEQIKENGWIPHLWTIEVGARGFVGRSFSNCIGKLGLVNREIRTLCKAVSITAAKCSYAIFLSAKNPFWDKERKLLGPEAEEKDFADTEKAK